MIAISKISYLDRGSRQSCIIHSFLIKSKSIHITLLFLKSHHSYSDSSQEFSKLLKKERGPVMRQITTELVQTYFFVLPGPS